METSSPYMYMEDLNMKSSKTPTVENGKKVDDYE